MCSFEYYLTIKKNKMRNLVILFMLFAATAAYGQNYCGARTASGGDCRHKVTVSGDKCWQHGGNTAKPAQSKATSPSKGTQKTEKSAAVQCSGVTKAGNRCKNRTTSGQFCHLHR